MDPFFKFERDDPARAQFFNRFLDFHENAHGFSIASLKATDKYVLIIGRTRSLILLAPLTDSSSITD
jgi:hypothetical protein